MDDHHYDHEHQYVYASADASKNASPGTRYTQSHTHTSYQSHHHALAAVNSVAVDDAAAAHPDTSHRPDEVGRHTPPEKHQRQKG